MLTHHRYGLDFTYHRYGLTSHTIGMPWLHTIGMAWLHIPYVWLDFTYHMYGLTSHTIGIGLTSLPIGFRNWQFYKGYIYSGDINVCCYWSWCSGTGKRFSNRNETSCLHLLNARLIQGLWNQISSRLNARWHTDWAIEDQAKYLNSTARPYDQRTFCPLDLTAGWLLHLALTIYMVVVFHVDALAQASDLGIESRQVVFLCWMQNSNQGLWDHTYLLV